MFGILCIDIEIIKSHPLAKLIHYIVDQLICNYVTFNAHLSVPARDTVSFLTIHNPHLPIVMICIIVRVEPEMIRLIMKLAQKP